MKRQTKIAIVSECPHAINDDIFKAFKYTEKFQIIIAGNSTNIMNNDRQRNEIIKIIKNL